MNVDDSFSPNKPSTIGVIFLEFFSINALKKVSNKL